MLRTTNVSTILTAMILLAAGSAVRAGDWDIPADPSKFAIFILDGQSNMVGAGTILPAQGDTTPVPHILRLEGQLNLDTGTVPIPTAWSPAKQPLFDVQTANVGYSLGIDFAKQYQASHPGVTVGLITAAWGGAGIDALDKGSTMYANMISRTQWAMNYGTIKGVLWHQGETDTTTATLANSYAGKLDQLVSDIRTDLGLPNLPFIDGNLAEFYGTGPEHNAPARVAQIGTVKAALRGLPDRVDGTAFVETTGLTSLNAHMVHFDRTSLITLGGRYAAAYENLTNTPEPGTMSLLGVALFAMLAYAWRKRK